tara:strand:- start:75 stop:323 length:249 start_codon:yes stop_codon:yes gene_type:complete
MEKKGWKTLAIVLSVIFILEIIGIIALMPFITEESDGLCQDICEIDDECSYTSFDDYLFICEQYDSEDNLIRTIDLVDYSIE